MGTPSVLLVISDENLENVWQVVGEKTQDLSNPWRFLSLWTSKMLAYSTIHKAKGCVLQATWTLSRDRSPFTASRIFSIPQELYHSKRWNCKAVGFVNRALSHQLEFHTDSRSVTFIKLWRFLRGDWSIRPVDLLLWCNVIWLHDGFLCKQIPTNDYSLK